MQILNIRRRSIITYLPIFLSIFYLLVDSLNGFLKEGLGKSFSVSQPYKLFILALFILFLLRKKELLLFPIITLFFLTIVFHIPSYESISDLSKDFLWPLRFLLILVSFFFFYHYHKESLSLKDTLPIAYFSFWILGINLIVGVLGFGFSQYDGGIGSKGFIYAGNDMSGAIIASGSIILMHSLEEGKYKKYLIYSLFFILFSVIKVTKTAILASIIISIFFPLIKIFSNKVLWIFKKNYLRFLAISTFSMLTLSIIAVYLALYAFRLIDRLSYFYRKSDSLATFILSNRNIDAVKSIDLFLYDFTFTEKLFGKGHSFINNYFGRILEIDILDFLIGYGIVGVSITYGLFLFVFFISLSRIRHTSFTYAKYVCIVVFLLIVISLTAGHILMSAIGGILFGYLLSLASFKQRSIAGSMND